MATDPQLSTLGRMLRFVRGCGVACIVAGMLAPSLAGEQAPSPVVRDKFAAHIAALGGAVAHDARMTTETIHAAALSPPSAVGGDRLGFKVAISGETTVAYAFGRQETYIFERNAGGADQWGLTKTISRRANTVAIDGDTLAMGQTAFRWGWVYIHERNAGGPGNWGVVQVLVGPVDRERDFAAFVRISGDTVVVTQPGTHEVRLYERHAGGANAWGETVGFSAPIGNWFGLYPAIDGDTLVIPSSAGNEGRGAVDVYERNAGSWSQVAHLTSPDGGSGFGSFVSVHGNTVVVGKVTDAYVFERNAGGAGAWGVVAKLTPRYPFPEHFSTVSIYGDRIVASTPGNSSQGRTGGAYVFARNQGGADIWGQVARLSAPTTTPHDQFGVWVAIDRRRFIVSAESEDGAAIDSGAAHLFTITGREWVEVTKAADGEGAAGDAVGAAASLSGDTLVVGAPFDDTLAEDAGVAYVLRRNAVEADAWGRVAKLTAMDGAVGDRFGAAAAIDRNTIVIGSRDESDGQPGAVYVYERNAGGADGWGETATLVVTDGGDLDGLGRSVGIAGHLVVAGAPSEDEPGEALVFARDAGGAGAWGQVARLSATDGEPGDGFGTAVAINGTTIAIGAELRDDMTGAAYVFNYDAASGAWFQVRKLTASDGVPGSRFGGAVAIRRSTLAVGAAQDGQAGPLSGAAYVFERDLGGVDRWGEARKLMADDALAAEYLGTSVAVGEGQVVAGAPGDGPRGDDFGAAYVFARNAGGAENWGQVGKLVPAEGSPDDEFGGAVAIEGATVAGGAPGNLGTGAAWVFRDAGGLCGNANVDPGETCDDGDLIDVDGCSSSCAVEPCDDTDGDGFGLLGRPTCPGGSVLDCRPFDATVYPDAPELCDGRATDCEGPEWPSVPADEVDHDGDGLAECEGDCNDGSADTYPGAPEICDTENNDCNAPDWPTPSEDNVDLDGDGYALCNGECDDTNPTVYPRAFFLCDGINNDCWDSFWPDPRPIESDADGDGWWVCSGDCNDADPSAYPGASEICNGIDDDCNDLVDEDPLGVDSDVDSHANACDNCPLTANFAQTDQDADGVGDTCDLDDGVIWLALASSGTVGWQEETGYDVWNLYRGDLAVLSAGGGYTQAPGSNPVAARFCGRITPTVDDPFAPGLGATAFYLVTGVAGSEGDLGTDSMGSPRPNAAPCP